MFEMVGREREFEQLQKLAAAPPALVVLTGRRRIGKTFLLREALPGARVVSFQSEQQPRLLQLEAFARECSRLIPGEPPLSFSSWGHAFEFIEKQAQEAGPLVLVLDEFQYLAGSDPALPSTIQRFWDRFDGRRVPVMIVLSGSALSFMTGLLGGGQPLFGRSVYRPVLQPLSYRQIAPFAPSGTSLVSLVERFAVLGGTPQYQVWGGSVPLKRVLSEVLLSEDSALYRDPEHLIREEESIREPGPYFGALESIARGYTSTAAIAGRLEMSQPLVMKFLARLRELGYVTRMEPLEPKLQGASRGYWKISDPFFRFWFRYILPNRSAIARGRPEEVAALVQQDLSTFVGPIFEDCCREWVGRYSDLGANVIDVGSWWSRKSDVEIDVVTLTKRGYGLLGSCKWWTNKVGHNVLDELLAAKVALGVQAASAQLAIFSRSGFTSQLRERALEDGVRLVEIGEIFS